ncbi:MAG: bifunctional phosphoribosylaminoimidazolecarboxamide formyltransferase/IMP cyclohydrolase, partial [Eubacteriales bacterium]|nr:bifunctional phosphoribosylaminoimidazolecarboxamide formyltransferase/IMP cyclohydrolase [Eubacteriales bacterium]
GGTAKALADAGIRVTGVSEVTGFPECLDGRVKTLHPKIHGGILAVRNNPGHMKQLAELGIETIDIVVINLYPFRQTIMREGVELEEAIENIDIGGPTMLRAAAKNYRDVAVITDPSDYEGILKEYSESGGISQETKFRLACKVFEHTSHYDTLICTYLRKQAGLEGFPGTLTLTFEKAQDMRYGENPHQKAVFYKETGSLKGCLAGAQQLHGKELSYNNINDTNGAIELLKEFSEPAVVAVKHSNPCGTGTAPSIYEAYLKAYESDPVSIFGGIVAANREIDVKMAEEINKIFIEIVIGPSYAPGAVEILAGKKNIRILRLEDIAADIAEDAYDMKKVAGGLLVQEYDRTVFETDKIEFVTEKKPSEKEIEDMLFAMKVCKHTKSNAIVMAKDNATIGIGPGQLNRIMSVKIAAGYAGERAKGAVMASDAYFPFEDCVEAAAAAGITAIVQPGGSINDRKSIDACNKAGISMIFTGMRHFRH